MKLALAAVLMLGTACDKPLPSRPDEATFRAADPMEKCKLTEPRANRCNDDLMIEEVRTLTGSDKDMAELANTLEEGVKLDKPSSAEDRHVMHKTRCLGNVDTSYADGIFECWDIADCKKFAQCVMKTPARP